MWQICTKRPLSEKIHCGYIHIYNKIPIFEQKEYWFELYDNILLAKKSKYSTETTMSLNLEYTSIKMIDHEDVAYFSNEYIQCEKTGFI